MDQKHQAQGEQYNGMVSAIPFFKEIIMINSIVNEYLIQLIITIIGCVVFIIMYNSNETSRVGWIRKKFEVFTIFEFAVFETVSFLVVAFILKLQTSDFLFKALQFNQIFMIVFVPNLRNRYKNEAKEMIESDQTDLGDVQAIYIAQNLGTGIATVFLEIVAYTIFRLIVK